MTSRNLVARYFYRSEIVDYYTRVTYTYDLTLLVRVFNIHKVWINQSSRVTHDVIFHTKKSHKSQYVYVNDVSIPAVCTVALNETVRFPVRLNVKTNFSKLILHWMLRVMPRSESRCSGTQSKQLSPGLRQGISILKHIIIILYLFYLSLDFGGKILSMVTRASHYNICQII